MHSFLANLRIDSSLFTFFFVLGRYSRSIYRETKQYGLILKVCSIMRGREDSLSSCNQEADCLRSHSSSMLVPTDRRLSCHSGLAVTLSTTTEKLKTRLSLYKYHTFLPHILVERRTCDVTCNCSIVL